MDQTPPSDGFSQPPLHAQVVPEPIPAQPRRKSGVFARFLVTLLVLGFLGSLALNFFLFVAGRTDRYRLPR